jgi:hypothetical protein
MEPSMKIFIGGNCCSEAAFNLLDPSAFTEGDFEAHAVKALVCAFPEYRCIAFRADFSFENQIRRSDLALVHKTFSHWFVVEVELLSHSLMGHVVPQVRCFRYGEPLSSTATVLCGAIPEMDYAHALSFLQFIPRSVVVVANRDSTEWRACFRGLDVQMLTVSVYQRNDGQIAHEINGSLFVVKENLGFFRYSAIDRSLRLPLTFTESGGRIQIEDPFGASGTWLVSRTDDAVWLTKEMGDPGLPHNEMLQVIRTSSGKLKLSLTSL